VTFGRAREMRTIDNSIYLASRSPRRKELLQRIGIRFHDLLESADGAIQVDETPATSEDPAEYVMRLARAKAGAAMHFLQTRSLPVCPVLAADTTVALGGHIFGKPDTARHAAAFLAELSGRTHSVFTAVAVASESRIETELSASAVEFRQLSDMDIQRYVATGEPLDKAGAYAIQGEAAAFVRALNGSYSGIMGLPVFQTLALLRRFGVTPM